jgi:molybdopterin molybdotransferase
MIQDLWKRLEAWAGANAPAMLEDLNPGADDAEVVSLQESLGIKLPTAFIESLKIHNGESDGWPYKVFAGRGAYLATKDILKNWNLRKKIAVEMAEYEEQLRERIIAVDGPVKPLSFSPKWIPFMDCNSDIFWAMDFDPDEGGVAGQIIEVDFEGAAWKVIADSFEDFFDTHVSSLEANVHPV